jgi:hypothetical protein
MTSIRFGTDAGQNGKDIYIEAAEPLPDPKTFGKGTIQRGLEFYTCDGTSFTLVSGGTGGYDSLYKGLASKTPLSDKNKLFPFGVSQINTSTLGGTTVTNSIDTTTTFFDYPTTKLIKDAGGSPGSQIYVGSSTTYWTIPADVSDFLNRTLFVAIKSTGALISYIILEVGDGGGYANRYAITFAKIGSRDGWDIFSTAGNTASIFAPAGTPNIAVPIAYRLRLALADNTPAATFNISNIFALEKQAPSVVFTCDDTLSTAKYLRDAARKRGIPVSFSLALQQINAGNGWSHQDVIDTVNDKSGLFEFTNHAVNDDRVNDVGAIEYVNRVEQCRNYLQSVGVGDSRNIHVWVGGVNYQSGEVVYQHQLSIAEQMLKDLGYSCARTSSAVNLHMQSLPHGAAGSGNNINLWRLKTATALSSANNLAAVKTHLENTAANGGACINSHSFAAAANSTTWIAGYDENYGVLNLLDWLADKRDNDGWRLLKFSEWNSEVFNPWALDVF